jgi:hypothetical protein
MFEIRCGDLFAPRSTYLVRRLPRVGNEIDEGGVVYEVLAVRHTSDVPVVEVRILHRR